jgi:D-alanyl-D-alanine carboxypeptidase/D-alanyl-D-alanine-endopeptidase (penicillin-binding protein 4)
MTHERKMGTASNFAPGDSCFPVDRRREIGWLSPFFRILLATLLASACTAADLTDKIDALVEKTPASVHATIGIHVVDLKTGKTLYARNDNRLFLPASNMKLFTAALALERLGPDYHFTTRLVRVPSGDVVLQGGGDPSLSGRVYPYQKDPASSGDPLRAIEEMADQAIAAGLVRVDGDVIGDDQLYPWAPYPPSWTADDVIHEDGAPVSALTLNDNEIALTIQPGEVGDNARISVDPKLEYYAIDNRIVTVAAAGQPNIRVARQPGSRQLLLWGSIPVRAMPVREFVAIDDPALFAACAMYDALTRRGVPIRGQPVARHRPVSGDADPIDGDVLATRTSPPLVEVLQLMTKVSENLHAELMLREVGRVRRRSGTRETGLEELGAFLTQIGTTSDEWRAEDGSGLSRNDEVTPRAMTRLLTHMTASKNADAWLSLLPRGGEDGTLSNRLCCASDTRQVRAKTGTLTRAITLSGYADSKARGRLAFSILVNNYSASTSDVRAWVDTIAMTLVE